jgi:predicted RNase H-like HicB family nuclease
MEHQVSYRVSIHHEDGSYWAEVDDLPGCFAAGDTIEELNESLTEAVALYLSTPDSECEVRIDSISPVEGSTVEQVDAQLLVC